MCVVDRSDHSNLKRTYSSTHPDLVPPEKALVGMPLSQRSITPSLQSAISTLDRSVRVELYVATRQGWALGARLYPATIDLGLEFPLSFIPASETFQLNGRRNTLIRASVTSGAGHSASSDQFDGGNDPQGSSSDVPMSPSTEIAYSQGTRIARDDELQAIMEAIEFEQTRRALEHSDEAPTNTMVQAELEQLAQRRQEDKKSHRWSRLLKRFH